MIESSAGLKKDTITVIHPSLWLIHQRTGPTNSLESNPKCSEAQAVTKEVIGKSSDLHTLLSLESIYLQMRSIRVCSTGLMQNVKASSAPVLAWLESWSGSRLSLSIAVRCSQTTFSIMHMTDVRAMREVTWKLAVCGSFPPSPLGVQRLVLHPSSWVKAEWANPMSETLCSREALSNAPSVALERSIHTVGQHSAAFTEWFHNVICDEPGVKCRWDRRMSKLQSVRGNNMCWST